MRLSEKFETVKVSLVEERIVRTQLRGGPVKQRLA
jgi:hypothetical protein